MWFFAALIFIVIAAILGNPTILVAAAIFAVAGEISIFTCKFFDDHDIDDNSNIS